MCHKKVRNYRVRFLPQAESYWKLTVCVSRLDTWGIFTSLPTANKMYLVFMMPRHCDLPGSMLLIKTKRITELIGCSWTVCSCFAVGYLPQVESRILSIFCETKFELSPKKTISLRESQEPRIVFWGLPQAENTEAVILKVLFRFE